MRAPDGKKDLDGTEGLDGTEDLVRLFLSWSTLSKENVPCNYVIRK